MRGDGSVNTPVKVAIDLTALMPEATGVDNYLKHLVLSLARVDRDSHYTLFLNYEDRRLFDGQLPDNFQPLPLSIRARAARLAFQQGILPLAAGARGIHVTHSPSFIMPMVRGRQRHVLTIYDMTSFSLPSYHIPLRRSAAYRTAVQLSIRRADVVTVPSRSARQEILDLVPGVDASRLRIVEPGISEQFTLHRDEDVGREIRRLGLPARYILHVGTIEPRKNLGRLIEAYRALIERDGLEEHLVLVGRLGWAYDALLAQVQTPQLRGRVHVRGYVPQRDLPWVYAGARLFVYPSLWEGFGFPPLEAMACGVPVVVSSTSAMSENLAGAAELVAPDDVESLTSAMRRLLSDEPLRRRARDLGLERARRFRWENTAREMRACYQALATSQ
jgi:glycosyltransferase involved in cell wall biosynthesis